MASHVEPKHGTWGWVWTYEDYVGGVDSSRSVARVIALAEQFPSMRGRPGVRPWDPAQLDELAVAIGASPEMHAVRFLLHVWDPWREWRCGRFDLLDALDHWDERHRAAFAEWSRDPWWPLQLASRRIDEDELSRDTLPSLAPLEAYEAMLDAEARETWPSSH